MLTRPTSDPVAAAERSAVLSHRPARAWLLAAVAFVGPAAVGVARGVLPYDSVDDTATIVSKVLAAPDRQEIVLWAGWVAALTLPVGVLLAGTAARAVRPRLGAVAAATAWIGYASLFAGAGLDALVPAAAEAGLQPDMINRLSLALDATPPGFVGGVLFVVGHVAGTTLLGIALWRAIPRWAALLLLVSQPLHFVVAVVLVNHAVDAFAWTATGLGLAVTVWRTVAVTHP